MCPLAALLFLAPRTPRAISKCMGQEALQEVIGLGKLGKVSKKTAAAAYAAYMKTTGK